MTVSRASAFAVKPETPRVIAHENVVEILDAAETEDGHPYLVMELLEGEALRATIARGPLPIPAVLALGIQIARGLAAAHEVGIVHSDLKPDNVIVVGGAGRGCEARGLRDRASPRGSSPDGRRRPPRHARLHGARAGARRG